MKFSLEQAQLQAILDRWDRTLALGARLCELASQGKLGSWGAAGARGSHEGAAMDGPTAPPAPNGGGAR